MPSVVKIGVLKAGCIGTLPLLEVMLDERADRADIDVRVIGSGAKLGPEQCREVAEQMIRLKPDLVILIGPAQAAPGPSEARRILSEAGLPTIVISDLPAKKLTGEIEKAGMGYIIVEADSMIGARREFLDPTEMVLFNSDVIRVLAATGAFNLVVEAIDRAIEALKRGEAPELPRLVIDGAKAVEAAGFLNPYAGAKALAAYEMARQVSRITTAACFKTQDPKVYIPMVAAAHELMREAAKLADEAREIEKGQDQVLRRPHFKDGSAGTKRRLMEKPARETLRGAGL
ncbi:MAG: methylenetetrahydromethanopterin dehydrogenase [Candidatus Bathyarchaeota archaeon B63]|nr:MAG: methylenetetrahydromethanopterin dehydrogenase [Candidatus Bathyarchaeota archaeon B63]